MSFALVIGAGPAGLMAAETLGRAGIRVVVAEAMPTPARKFLMAGKSGLNLTKAESATRFAAHLPPELRPTLRFGPEQVQEWARGLGIELFTGSTGRVFPVGMKASPLLRAWLARLAAQGTELRTRWRWTADGRSIAPDGPHAAAGQALSHGIRRRPGMTGAGHVFHAPDESNPDWPLSATAPLATQGTDPRTRQANPGGGFTGHSPDAPHATTMPQLAEHGLRTHPRWNGLGFTFDTPEGPQTLHPAVAVLALGGASWPRLGADAGWVAMLRQAGVDITPFRPANMGFRVEWSDPMRRHLGAAVKGTALAAGTLTSRGEWVITAQGIEGGGIYEISAALRDGAEGRVDLAPDLDVAALTLRLSKPPGRLSVGNWLRRILPDPVKIALLMEWGRPLPTDPAALARLMKALPLRHHGPLGIDRAISVAGGIAMGAVTPDLELRALPGIFVAGEMLDWEAPTGGYLLTTCLATGKAAGEAALRHLAEAV